MTDITVFTTQDEPIADMAVGLLEAEGIVARKISFIKGTLPFTMDGLGAIYIKVGEEDAARAVEMLSARFSSIYGEDSTSPDPDNE